MKKEYCDNCGIKFNQNKDRFTAAYKFKDGKELCQYCRFKYCGTKADQLKVSK